MATNKFAHIFYLICMKKEVQNCQQMRHILVTYLLYNQAQKNNGWKMKFATSHIFFAFAAIFSFLSWCTMSKFRQVNLHEVCNSFIMHSFDTNNDLWCYFRWKIKLLLLVEYRLQCTTYICIILKGEVAQGEYTKYI